MEKDNTINQLKQVLSEHFEFSEFDRLYLYINNQEVTGDELLGYLLNKYRDGEDGNFYVACLVEPGFLTVLLALGKPSFHSVDEKVICIYYSHMYVFFL